MIQATASAMRIRLSSSRGDDQPLHVPMFLGSGFWCHPKMLTKVRSWYDHDETEVVALTR